MRFTLGLLLFFALVAFGASAGAQDLVAVEITRSGTPSPQVCAPGRSITALTAGRCCWPGQRWSDDDGRCTGIPTCPPGFGGSGDGCAQMVDFRSNEFAGPGPGSRSAGAARGALIPVQTGEPLPEGAHIVQLANWRMMGAGATTLAIAYIASFSTGMAGLAQCGNPYGSCYLWTWTIPIIGPLISPMIFHQPYGDTAGLWAAGVAMSATQFLATFIFAYGFRRRPYAYIASAGSSRSRGARWAVLPGAAGAEVGLTLGITAF